MSTFSDPAIVAQLIATGGSTDDLALELGQLPPEELAAILRLAEQFRARYHASLATAASVIELAEKHLALHLEPRGDRGTVIQVGTEKIVYWVRAEEELLHLHHVILSADQ